MAGLYENRVLGVIVARSGSKRFPGKNSLPWVVGSLFSNTVGIMRAAGIRYIVVSTDVASIVQDADGMDDVFVHIRPEHLRGDNVSTADVVYDLITSGVFPGAKNFQHICLCQITSPLTNFSSLSKALYLAVSRNVPAVVSVSPAYKPNGCFYIVRQSLFLRERTFFVDGMHLFRCSWDESVDIDYEYDYHIARALYYRRVSEGDFDTISYDDLKKVNKTIYK